jgi:hypothetical protein
MARVCATCREPVSPVNLCVCDDDEPDPEDSSDEADAA